MVEYLEADIPTPAGGIEAQGYENQEIAKDVIINAPSKPVTIPRDDFEMLKILVMGYLP